MERISNEIRPLTCSFAGPSIITGSEATLTITGQRKYVERIYSAIVFGIEAWDESELTP